MAGLSGAKRISMRLAVLLTNTDVWLTDRQTELPYQDRTLLSWAILGTNSALMTDIWFRMSLVLRKLLSIYSQRWVVAQISMSVINFLMTAVPRRNVWTQMEDSLVPVVKDIGEWATASAQVRQNVRVVEKIGGVEWAVEIGGIGYIASLPLIENITGSLHFTKGLKCPDYISL